VREVLIVRGKDCQKDDRVFVEGVEEGDPVAPDGIHGEIPDRTIFGRWQPGIGIGGEENFRRFRKLVRLLLIYEERNKLLLEFLLSNDVAAGNVHSLYKKPVSGLLTRL
jgi:hypothetical protein